MMYISNKKFTGLWKDKQGKTLIIKCRKGRYLTDFYTSDSNEVNRVLLENITKGSINMKSFVNGDELVVELGTEGAGPTLKLKYSNVNRECLIPTVEMGLYDDWDEDFGVPWVLPLSVYHKI